MSGYWSRQIESKRQRKCAHFSSRGMTLGHILIMCGTKCKRSVRRWVWCILTDWVSQLAHERMWAFLVGFQFAPFLCALYQKTKSKHSHGTAQPESEQIVPSRLHRNMQDVHGSSKQTWEVSFCGDCGQNVHKDCMLWDHRHKWRRERTWYVVQHKTYPALCQLNTFNRSPQFSSQKQNKPLIRLDEWCLQMLSSKLKVCMFQGIVLAFFIFQYLNGQPQNQSLAW